VAPELLPSGHMLRRTLRVFFLIAVVVSLQRVAPALATSSAKTALAAEIEDLDKEVRQTRWDWNSLGRKRELEEKLRVRRKLWDRVVLYESSLVSLDCVDVDNHSPTLPTPPLRRTQWEATPAEVNLLESILRIDEEIARSSASVAQKLSEEWASLQAELARLRLSHCP
jgi:hypothetical protein